MMSEDNMKITIPVIAIEQARAAEEKARSAEERAIKAEKKAREAAARRAD